MSKRNSRNLRSCQIVRHMAAGPESCNCRAERGFTMKAGAEKGGQCSLIGSRSEEGEWFLPRQCGHRGCDGGALHASISRHCADLHIVL